MPYATNTDVAAEFKGGYTFNSSTFTTAQVDEWCTRASNFIDAKIAGKYQTPVAVSPSPTAFSILKEICVWMVAARVATRGKIQTGEQKQQQQISAADYQKMAMDSLDEIAGGKMKLVDGVLATSADGAQSFTNDNSATLQPPTFTREDDSW